jgi:hypothetical protein
VIQSSFPHRPGWQDKKNVVFVILGGDSAKACPYNPLTAAEHGAKRRRTKQQATEIKKKFSISGFRIFGLKRRNSDQKEKRK